MKRKVIVSLLLLFLFFSVGAVLSTLYIRTTTASLERLIKLHQIENLRQDLIMSIQAVQSELYTVGTLLGHKADTITESVNRLEGSANKCSGCHHAEEIEKKLKQTELFIHKYEDALSYYITAAANRENIDRMKVEAATIGNDLLQITEQMSIDASSKLSSMTKEALTKVDLIKTILVITTVLTFIFGIFIAFRLTESITRPINVLVNAARAIASGDLGHMVSYKDKTEFGELAANFNVMSSALKEGYSKLEQEIAERKQTESALVKSEAFLNTIFESIHDPFCIFDREFRIVWSNDAYAATKSMDLDALTTKTCYKVLYGRDTLCDDCIVEKTFLSGDACAKEKLGTTPDGYEAWFEIYTYPIRDSDGTMTHVIEYSRDISERKRAEAALRESEQRYALAAEGANDGLWDWNLRENRIYYSVRWKSMLGYSDREIGNDPDEWFSRVHADDLEKVSSRINAYVHHGDQHFEIEYRIRHKDGTYRWMLC
jgi:PAS domain S-box-containing protein